MTPSPDATIHTDRVRRYYDRTVTAFERLGQGGASIHRAVWGPGVATREAAHHFVDELILAALPAGIDQPTVVDLGCGLGASLLYLAQRTGAQRTGAQRTGAQRTGAQRAGAQKAGAQQTGVTGEGITISPGQVTRAAELIAEAELGDRVRCRVGDFLAVPDDLVGRADVTFSIEAFVHSPDAEAYLHEAARTLRPGGHLIICDDFLTTPDAPAAPKAARWLDDFRSGWRVGSLLTVDQIRTLAAAHGLTLVRDLDLTSWLALRRPRDRWISLLVTLGRLVRPSGDYWQSLVGGDALQRALGNGLLSYRFLEFSADDRA